jgi:hypothetical protein
VRGARARAWRLPWAWPGWHWGCGPRAADRSKELFREPFFRITHFHVLSLFARCITCVLGNQGRIGCGHGRAVGRALCAVCAQGPRVREQCQAEARGPGLSQDSEGGTYSYLLDGDKATGSGFADAQEALAHIAQTTTFLFLDGQFTALEDLGGAERPDLADAPRLEVTLDPLGRGERAIDPQV